MSTKMTPMKHGVRIGPLRVISAYAHDGSHGFILWADRQQVDVRVTPSGLLRVTKPHKTANFLKEEDVDD